MDWRFVSNDVGHQPANFPIGKMEAYDRRQLARATARIQVRKSGSTSLPCRQYSDKRLVFSREVIFLVAFGLSQTIDNATLYLYHLPHNRHCLSRHISIDFPSLFTLPVVANPAREGRRPAPPADGAGAGPAGVGSSPALPGGFGATPGRHYDRPARSSLDWDRKLRVPGSASGAELRRWLAAASAAVERRQAARRVDFVCTDLRTLVCVAARRAPA